MGKPKRKEGIYIPNQDYKNPQTYWFKSSAENQKQSWLEKQRRRKEALKNK